MTDSDAEIQHALTILQEISGSSSGWYGPKCILEIDPVCMFGFPPCRKRLARAIVLQSQDRREVSVLGVCLHHADIMDTAIQQWRKRN